MRNAASEKLPGSIVNGIGSGQFQDRHEVKRKTVASTVITGCFLIISAILLPRGVGFVGISALQLSRLACIALIGVAVCYVCVSKRFLLVAPRTMGIICFIVCLQFLAALNSDSMYWSMQWAINYAITIFMGAFAFLLLSGNAVSRSTVVKALMLISVLLASISVFEFVTQLKVFPYRNIYAEHSTTFSTSLRRIIVEDGKLIETPFASIGPYMNNLMFSGFLCSVGGILMLAWKKGKPKRNFLGTALFTFSVLATQSRAGFIAMFVMVLVSVAITENRKTNIFILFGWLFGISTYIGICGTRMSLMVLLGLPQVGIGLTSILVLFVLLLIFPLISLVANRSRALSACFMIFPLLIMLMFLVETTDTVNAGSFKGRIHGIKLLFSTKDVWFLGAGPGSLLDSERVITAIRIFSDQGSFFSLIGESGILVGVLLLYLVYKGVQGGLHRSNDPFVQAMGVGVLGCFITALSSVVVDVWLMIIVFTGLIEAWRRQETHLKEN